MWFWSSVNLTGNQTHFRQLRHRLWFWSSVNLTGNQTTGMLFTLQAGFWSSVNLTGNQTPHSTHMSRSWFWSSVNLTGNQTRLRDGRPGRRFWSGANLTGNQVFRMFRDLSEGDQAIAWLRRRLAGLPHPLAAGLLEPVLFERAYAAEELVVCFAALLGLILD